ncbi:MAG: hypothetical protein OXG24_05500 [Gammaproteobacteria bacterium]|nr:hypothetical protein [Gammaproteobacteria bacterium]
MGGGLRVSSHAAVGRKTIGARHRSPLDAILQGLPEFVAISQHLLQSPAVSVDGGQRLTAVIDWSKFLRAFNPLRLPRNERAGSPALSTLPRTYRPEDPA